VNHVLPPHGAVSSEDHGAAPAAVLSVTRFSTPLYAATANDIIGMSATQEFQGD